MALSVYATNASFTPAAINSDQTLATTTTAGVYGIEVDPTNMAGGDTVAIRCTSATCNAGTQTQHQAPVSISGAGQVNKLRAGPFEVGFAATFILNQSAGTARVLPFTIFQY